MGKAIGSVLLVLLCSSHAWASSLSLKMYEPKSNKMVELHFVKFEGKRISQSCLKKGKASCEAWASLKRSPAGRTSSYIPLLGHPASHFCQAYGARNLVLLDNQKKEFDYCFFKDNSAINSWDLYNAHQ